MTVVLQRTAELEQMLGSSGKIRILYLLIENKDMYLSSLSKKSNIEIHKVRHHLNKFENLGIVEIRDFSSVTFYRINESHPLVVMVTNLFASNDSYRSKCEAEEDVKQYSKLEKALKPSMLDQKGKGIVLKTLASRDEWIGDTLLKEIPDKWDDNAVIAYLDSLIDMKILVKNTATKYHVYSFADNTFAQYIRTQYRGRRP